MTNETNKPDNVSGEDYVIGYKKPPVETRFKPGVSGNKKGRPKGKRNHLTMLKQELDQQITITERGKRKTITAFQAAVKQVTVNAAKGHLPSFKEMIKLANMVASLDAEQGRGGATPELSREMMEHLKNRLLAFNNDSNLSDEET